MNIIKAIKKYLLLLVIMVNQSAIAQIYIFVSYSMPDSALQSYHQQAQQKQAILVMQGLKDDSFTATKVKADQLKIIYDINPELFDQYGIEEVPVIIKDDGEGRIKKIIGHLSLLEALRIMEDGD